MSVSFLSLQLWITASGGITRLGNIVVAVSGVRDLTAL